MKAGYIKENSKSEIMKIYILVIAITFVVFFLMKSVDFESMQSNVRAFSRAENVAVTNRADALAQGYYFDEAIELMQLEPKQINEQITEKIQEITDKKSSLQKYEGAIHHVFFHSLIVYPERAFDGGYMEHGYNMWMTTADEFKAMLPYLYEKGYVLYDIEELVEEDAENPKRLKRKDIYLPQGKRPLILSVDDVNYYDYMEGHGFAQKLVLDENAEVATQIVTPRQGTIITRDGDVVPILDDFVKQYPDFSHRGAKGILATTGYEGVFGYRITDVTGEELVNMQKELAPVVEKLKGTGWRIACHSYTHNDYFKSSKVTMEQLKYDTRRWQETIGKALGATRIYISPFGYKLKNDDLRYRYLVEEEGFDIFCYVGMGANTDFNHDNVFQGRFNLDGFQMNHNKSYINTNYFDVEEVLDKRRPVVLNAAN